MKIIKEVSLQEDIFWFDTERILEIIGVFDPDEKQEEKDKKTEEFWDRPIIR